MYKQILVPVDLNEKGFSDRAVAIAVWHAQHSGAEIHLLNVLPGIHMSMVASYFPKDAAQRMKQDVQTQLDDFAKQHINDAAPYQVHVAEGKAYKTILHYAEKLGSDLIVMPSHKRSKLDKAVLGSVASKVVQGSPVQVLVVKPQN
ncbi:universal stress protein [Vibrio renipiscarius]|uniref:Universal stress protein n=1 Tax=Vibrio renipiscarius TaxID=1461322 RepID=A0A0C2P4A9_9VIBR|nr:universal stress protein [Vibrio renipiscarius]KII77555.1 universal stress protein [Vibrio renipiscarius]KII81277.1 universal stress protein [Vibrio renipiscarius]